MAAMIRRGALFLLLVAAALFVLFPFFWMTATAMKVEGMGMSFEFIPRRVVEAGPFRLASGQPPEGLMKGDRTVVGEDGGVLFAWAAPEAREIALTVNGAALAVARDTDGVWRAAAEPAGDYEYAFTIRRDWRGAFSSLYTFDNFVKIAANKDYPFLKYLRNSFLVAFSSAILTVFVCALAAYVFAKKQFRGRDTLFWLFMAAMMIPGMMYMVPQFAIVTRLGWINSLAGLVIPHVANVFGLFMLRQFMQSIPDSLFEAARIDGAGEWMVFRKIVIPLAMPSMAILFLLTFVGQWNNFLWQLIVNTPESDLITLPVGLAMFKGQYETQWEQMMAASSFSIMPIVLLFLFTQRYLIEGLTAGGVKE